MTKQYTVKQLAKIAGTSVKTLHHYDEVGLLAPAQVGENGYRYYEHEQLIKLMRILFYRELDFSLEEIKQLLKDTDEDMAVLLTGHKKLLEKKVDRTKRRLQVLNQLIGAHKEGNNNSEVQKEYEAEAKERWGHTDAYRQSQERMKKWSKADLERIKKEGNEITEALAEVSDLDMSDNKVQELVKRHHNYIGSFYECSVQMYRGLGEMYFADPRFAAYYDKVKPGLAEFMSKAIEFYCEKRK